MNSYMKYLGQSVFGVKLFLDQIDISIQFYAWNW